EPFRGYLLVRSRYNLPSCSPPLRDLYFRAFDGSVALPIAEYNYGVRLGNLHRWDFHPLERQLASLQPPSGSSVDVTRGDSRPTTFRSLGDMSSNVKALGMVPFRSSHQHGPPLLRRVRACPRSPTSSLLCSPPTPCPLQPPLWFPLRVASLAAGACSVPVRPTTRAPATCRASETGHRLSATPECIEERR